MMEEILTSDFFGNFIIACLALALIAYKAKPVASHRKDVHLPEDESQNNKL